MSDNFARNSVVAGNLYFRLGVDAVVAHAPARLEHQPAAAREYFAELIPKLDGNLIVYNMPLTTNVSLPIEVCKATARKPRVIGIKDSENNASRLGELLRELGGQDSFSVFVGTGPLMATGLLQGADGIVPSVGNLVPALCRQFYDSVTHGDAGRTELLHGQLMEFSNIYQKGRSLGQSLAALKGAMSLLGLCGPDVFPPLGLTTPEERLKLRDELIRLGVPIRDANLDEQQTNHRPDDGRPRGYWTRTLPADSH